MPNSLEKTVSKYFLWKADNKDKYATFFTNEKNKFFRKNSMVTENKEQHTKLFTNEKLDSGEENTQCQLRKIAQHPKENLPVIT